MSENTFKSVVDEKYVILHKQISNHPNFDLQPIQREVVIEDVMINAGQSFDRGYHLKYYIAHYNRGVLDQSFIKSPKRWVITDSLLVAKRDIQNGFQPIPNPEYEFFVEKNKLDPKIPNPEYITDEEFSKVKPYLPNPEYVSPEELILIDQTILDEEATLEYGEDIFKMNPEYEEALRRSKLPEVISNLDEYNRVYQIRQREPEYIDNPEYVSDEELEMISPYIKVPAFSYILEVVKEYPFLLFTLIEFYLDEQDRDKFFDNYSE